MFIMQNNTNLHLPLRCYFFSNEIGGESPPISSLEGFSQIRIHWPFLILELGVLFKWRERLFLSR